MIDNKQIRPTTQYYYKHTHTYICIWINITYTIRVQCTYTYICTNTMLSSLHHYKVKKRLSDENNDYERLFDE